MFAVAEGAGQISGTPLSGSLPASGEREEGAKNFVVRRVADTNAAGLLLHSKGQPHRDYCLP
jgi:hypothetical protein